MPIIYDWTDVLLGPMLAAAIVEATEPRIRTAEHAIERARRDDEMQERVERSRWLEEQQAERSFPCGIVPDTREVETGLPRLNVLPADIAPPMAVTAAVLPTDVAFIRDGRDDVVELGRIPRTAILDVDVVDGSGAHIPDPNQETIEEPQLSLLVLKWKNQGTDDEDRFAFRSPWLAWQAGRKLMDARRG
jgi:hypothetical protein